jgi:DUF1365 family protein
VSTASCLYEGTIRHRRTGAPRSEFRHRVMFAYLDLAELPTLLGGRLVASGPGLLRVRRHDCLDGDAGTGPLDVAVRDRVQALGGERPTGPIRMLIQPRCLGMSFNPVSFYYCFDASGEHVQSILAEVTNTPWGERHAYLMHDGAPDSAVTRGSFAKALHVSPFFGMDHVYEASAATPGPTLSVHIANRRAGKTVFDATLALRRHTLDRRSAARMSARYPAATARVLALIYGHALLLKLRGARYVPHPARAAA